MAAERVMGKSGLLLLALCAALSLQVAEAANCTYSGTPGWAIAVIVMLALLLASLLCSCCLAPLCTGMCRKDDGCQTGISFGK
ncbi:hypothetical protein GDO78_022153 [Eleutherodactylus coqui]|uniref:Uncharacterized protein n=1 Tax=Eleutherodactylus coqui TaxID=57060 RepID=A0A8J6E9N1_ELECQ|nr:hypothetical protein GDO78_022153 [Eleutherodactylus coqui]